jgi:sugar phosphate isomerase/epimerase
MQGRLVPSTTGHLDSSPGPRWRDEFRIAGARCLHHIELVAERARDVRNPIWSEHGRSEVRSVASDAGVSVPSLCVNETLTQRFDRVEFAGELAARLAPVVAGLELRIVVLPLLEASDLDALDRNTAVRSVRLLADEMLRHGARLVVELGVSADESLLFLESVGVDVAGLCYDVGNATAAGLDAPAELRSLGGHVWHVHAKDKDARGDNVRFGTGRVDFAAVLAALDDQRYDGLVTMEATRGDDPAATAAEHRSFLLATQPTRSDRA